MSQRRHPWLSVVIALLVSVLVPAAVVHASDFTRFKDLKNDYLKVTDVAERQRSEDRYVEADGKVELQKVPYKEVLVTAVLIRKPPSTMDTMFSAGANPYLKLCLAPFDAGGKAMDPVCHPIHFESLVKGNVGTASFRLTEDMNRYEFRLTQKLPDKGSAIHLWVPTE